jgi:hypothetical protein
MGQVISGSLTNAGYYGTFSNFASDNPITITSTGVLSQLDAVGHSWTVTNYGTIENNADVTGSTNDTGARVSFTNSAGGQVGIVDIGVGGQSGTFSNLDPARGTRRPIWSRSARPVPCRSCL